MTQTQGAYFPLVRTLRRFAMVISVAVTLFTPIALGLEGYFHLASHLRTSARLSAERIAQHAFIHGDTWRFTDERMANLLSPFAAATETPRQIVEYVGGETVARIGEPISGPKTSASWTIVVQGRTEGTVRVEASLLPLSLDVASFAALGIGLGLATFLIIQLLPLRTLRAVASKLDAAQAELASSNARMAEAIEAFPDAFAVYDRDDRLIMFNSRLVDIYHPCPAGTVAKGRGFEEIIRTAVEHGLFPKVVGREESWIAERVRQHRTFDGAIEQELSDGRWLRIVERSTADGGRVGVRTDITSLKTAIQELLSSEAERDSLRQQFFHAQKMQALGNLAGGVAHDFNNLLSIIIGHADLLSKALPENPRLRNSAEAIVRSGLRGADLVKQILLYARRDQIVLSPLRLDQAIDEEFALLRSTLPSSIQLRRRITPNITVNASQTWIHQILVNLCVNANHAIGNNSGEIDIELETVTIETGDPRWARLLRGNPLNIAGPPTIAGDGVTLVAHHGVLNPGTHCRITVRDTGCGMEKAVLEHIFEPFFTTREVGGGTGLGLAAVSGIVTGINGALLVRTAPGLGATFEVYLPTIASLPESDRPPTALGSDAPQSGRVLFVDDEPDLVAVAKEQFEAAGYFFLALTDPASALRHFRAAPESWDLVVTDQSMPEMTGAVLAREMLALRPDTPIILCSGYSERVNQGNVAKLGVRELLMKPCRGDELLAAAKRALT